MGESAKAVDDDGMASIPEAISYAVFMQRTGAVSSSETLFERVLEVAPDHPDALHFFGLLKHQTGRSAEAVELIRRAIEVDETVPSMHINLGNVLLEMDRPELAAQAYATAILLDHDNVEAHNNLGVASRAVGDLAKAERAYRGALAINPRFRESWDNLGRLLSATNRPDEAIEAHRTALRLEPHNAATRRALVSAHAACDRHDIAIEILKEWLAEDPDSAVANHLLSALTGQNVPERASDAFVETTFDNFASQFDQRLASLEYRAPALVGNRVTVLCGTPAASLAVLDAGCGTGLCGPHLKPYASRLDGVDLSVKMLEKADARRCYDRLLHVELTRFLLDHPGVYDLVVSADTLCYFGDLQAVVAAAGAALRPGGRLVFTVEHETGPDPVKLNGHGRYSHGREHVAAALAEAGLVEHRLDPAHLRMERGQPVEGLVVSAVKP